MDQSLVFDAALIKKYDTAGPRYTSYPTAVQFHEGFTERHYRAAIARSEAEARARPKPLSLYFHVPFCDTVCFYCGCNKIVTKNRARTIPYLEHLLREIELQGGLFSRGRKVDQLHWGGGTPTFLNHEQMTALMTATRQYFSLHDDDSGEYSIEIDPREAKEGTIALLRELGFNRLSMGVQDFEPEVQIAVNRIQSESETFRVLNEACDAGFKSLNIDLIYGLPKQTEASFARTLEKIIGAGPDRLSVFNYAHLPEMFKTQRQIKSEELPSAAEKLAILQMTIERLTAAGYVYIGMDHFAKPNDELAVAQREGSLYRNFQGYSTHSDCDLVAMGPTSIGMVANCYAQNIKTLDGYYQAIDEGRLPIFRGVELSADDLLRREVIAQLICHFQLDKKTIEDNYSITFDDYFASELDKLRELAVDGLVSLDNDGIRVPPRGRLLIRNICMAFDYYLPRRTEQRYSKVI